MKVHARILTATFMLAVSELEKGDLGYILSWESFVFGVNAGGMFSFSALGLCSPSAPRPLV